MARASAAARTRLGQVGNWLRRSEALPTIAPLLGPIAVGQGPVWLRLERGTPPPADPTDRRPTCVVVTFVGVTGGVIGPDGRQTNLFQYEMSPRIDLAGALRKGPVREAFTAYATHAAAPNADPAVSAELWTAAVDALRYALPGGETDWRAGERPAGPRETPISTRVPTLEGTVILQDCCGVQVGNHVRQYNTFGYVLAPNVRTGELIQHDPLLAGAIVDYACNVNGPAIGSLQQCLADAVCESAEARLARPAGTGVHELPATVVGELGALAGKGGRQHDITSVRLDSSLNKVDRAFHGVQSRVVAAVKAAEHAKAMEAKRLEVAEAARVKAAEVAEAAQVRAAQLARRQYTHPQTIQMRSI